MLDTVRRYVEAGREALTPKKAEELVHALVQQGQVRADQAGRMARDLVNWSRRSSERFRDTIRHEVQKQMSRSGVASKAEVDSLKRRIRELESQAKAKPKPRTRKTTQRSAGTRSTSKTTTSRGTAARTKPPGSSGA
jgi:polyhydroxyalkanoate synthesis regulator phasin